MNTVNICNKCPTGCDSLTNKKTIELKCGHVFGKSCLLNWVESSNQKNCFLCNNPLTDNEISEIKPIPLQERAVSVSRQATRLFCRTISMLAPSFALCLAAGASVGAAGAVLFNVVNSLSGGEAHLGVVDGAVAGAAGALVGCATIAVGAYGAALVDAYVYREQEKMNSEKKSLKLSDN